MHRQTLRISVAAGLLLVLAATNARAQVTTLSCNVTVYDERQQVINRDTFTLTIDQGRGTLNGMPVAISRQTDGLSWQATGLSGGVNLRTGDYRSTNVSGGQMFTHVGRCVRR